jgi:hypothetical protein
MNEFGEHAKAFKDAFEAQLELSERSANDPHLQDVVLQDVLEEGRQRARDQMDALEEAAESDFLRAVLPPVEDPEVTRRRQGIESLRDTKAYQQGLYSEGYIDGKLADLPEPQPFNETDTRFAQAYWVGRFLTSRHAFNLLLSGRIAREPSQKATEGGELGVPFAALENENGGELVKPVVQAVFYRGDRVMTLNDRPVPLSRRLDLAFGDAARETLIEDARRKAIEYLIARPNEKVNARKLWEASMPAELDFNSATWNYYVGNFIRDELQIDGMPLISINKPSPEAKRRYYSLDSFEVSLEYRDDPYGQVTDSIVKLPNGRVISGKSGRLFRLLAASTEDKPVRFDDLLEHGIYTEAEIALQESRVALSGLVASLRYRLRNYQLDKRFAIQKTTVSSATSERPETAYYMAEHADLSKAVSETAIQSEPAAEDLPRFSLRDAAVLAAYLDQRVELLRRLDLLPLDPAIAERLKQGDGEAGKPTDQTALDMQRARAYGVIGQCLTPECLEPLLRELGDDDPRTDLLIYMFDAVQDEDQKTRLEKALRARAVQVIEEHRSRQIAHSELKSIRYEFDDDTPPVEIPCVVSQEEIVIDETLPFEPALSVSEPAPEPAAPCEPEPAAPPASPEVQLTDKSPAVPAWEKEFKRKIGEAIDQLEKDELMVPGAITARVASVKSSSTKMGTKTAMERMRRAGILKPDRHAPHETPLTVADLVAMQLFNTSMQELGKGQPNQHRAMKLIQSSVKAYFRRKR